MPLTYGIDEEDEELSVDVVQLNNVVLAMRPLIKKARVLVLRELASCIKRQKLKQSKAPENKGKRLGRKIVNKLAEIRLLKALNDIKLCKLVLANANPHDLLEKGGEGLQNRIAIRLAARPEIAEFVSNFRTKHSDWPTLVQYLLYKNTSGKWKTPEQKRKTKKRRKGDLPFPLVEQKDIMDNQTASSIKQFKAFKEENDRKLIAAQRRLLREEAEEEGKKLEIGDYSKAEDAHSIQYDNPEMKAFIGELIAKMDSGEDIDEYLVPGGGNGDSKLLVGAMKAGTGDGSMLQADGAMNLAASTKGRDHKVKKMEKQKVEVVTTSKSTEKETLGPRDLPRKQKHKTEGQEAMTSPLNSKADADDVIHEIIVEQVAEDGFNQEDGDDILGRDDVEMKKELRERRAKPEGDATHRGTTQQRHHHTFRRGRGNPYNRHGPVPRRRAPGTPEAPLHPSWAAKREQKALHSLRTKALPSGTRIVFNDDIKLSIALHKLRHKTGWIMRFKNGARVLGVNADRK
uniref:Vasodilator stimulated phosphoprotein:sprouty n=1 Tax=Echinococcus granulosus TaxID=6210 RepID=A0A068WUL2_ECHGR|nr:vasodilator stimulated phosphoprotein:sprouty [Echinococcus granulosus]